MNKKTIGLLVFGAMCAASSAAAARSVTALDVAVDENGAAVATATFTAGTEGDAHAVYYVWSRDGVDKGADLAAWPNVLRVGRVADDATTISFELPPAAMLTPQYAARVFLATSGKPYDYLVENIYVYEATTCYLDTGYCPVGGKTAVTMDLALPREGTDAAQYYVFGANNGTFAYCAYINGSGRWAFACNNGWGTWSNPSTLSASTERVQVSLDASVSPSVFTVTGANGSVRLTSDQAHAKTSTVNLLLFGRSKSGGANDKECALMFYSCSVTNDGVCVHDYVPGVKDGVYGIYDRVNNTFSPSSGSKPFGETSMTTNVTYFVAEGDEAVASSLWLQTTSDFVIDAPYVEDAALAFDFGGSKSGAAPLTLTGKNVFGGMFTVKEGTLVADFGQGLAATDSLVLAGGLYCPLTAEALSVSLGAGAGNVSVAPGAAAFGFSALGHPLTVTIGDAAQPVEFGTGSAAGFDPERFYLNCDWATDRLTLKNGIVGNDADDAVPTVDLYTGAAEAVIEGGISNLSFTKTGDGTLVLNGLTNTLGRVDPLDGKLVIAPPAGEELCRLSIGRFVNSQATPAEVVVSNAVVSHASDSMLWYNGTTVTFAGCTVESAGNWYPGNRSGSSGDGAGGIGTLVLDGTSFTTSEEVLVGWYSHAKDNCKGILIVTNDSTLVCKKVFYGRCGEVRQYSGHVKCAYTGGGGLRIGASTGYGSFHYHLYGGTLEHSSSGQYSTFSLGFGDGDHPTGNLYVHPGGTFISRGRNGFVGRYAGNTGNLYVRGGTAQMTYSGAPLYVGYVGSGRLEVSDGGITDINGDVVALPRSATTGRTGVVELLTNGTLTAKGLYSTCTNDTARLVFDGGSFVAKTGAQTDFIYGFTEASVGVGGGTIDTAGQDLSVTQSFAAVEGQVWDIASTGAALASAPAFTKTGAGTLTLVGTNTYLCATCVSNGTLVAACGKSLPETTAVRLGADGTLDLGGYTHTVAALTGSGMVKNGTLAVTGAVWPGYGDSGTLTIEADVTLNPAKLAYAVAADGTCGTLKVNGTLDLTGVEITVDNPEAAKRGLRLVEATSVTGTPTSGLSGRYALVVRGGSVRLGVSAMTLIIR